MPLYEVSWTDYYKVGPMEAAEFKTSRIAVENEEQIPEAVLHLSKGESPKIDSFEEIDD